MKARTFKEEIPALPINLFQNHYVLVFDLTSLQDARENINYPELSGESIPLEIIFDRRLRSVTDLIVLRERMFTVKTISLDRLQKMSEDFCVNKIFSCFFHFCMGFTILLSVFEHLWVIYYCQQVTILITK